MAAGLGVLRLSPAAFWTMTPRELAMAWRALNGSTASSGPLARDELDGLMRQFPDN